MSVIVCLTDFKVCFISLHSLGVALSRGHGKYFFRGNVTVEEGKIPTFSCCLHSSFTVDLVDLKLACLSADSIRELGDFFFFSLNIFYFMGFFPLIYIKHSQTVCESSLDGDHLPSFSLNVPENHSASNVNYLWCFLNDITSKSTVMAMAFLFTDYTL